MMLDNLHLMRPEWLWCLIPALLLSLLLWQQQRSNGSWSNVIAPDLLQHLVGEPTGKVRSILLPGLLLGWTLACLAAAGPSWKQIPQPIHQKQDALVVVLDLSYSMKSGDLAPSRLDRTRQKLLDLLVQRREGQTGLVAYAGDAHIVTPLTDDTPTIANLLPALNPDMMPVPGSDPQSAIAMAVDLLRSAGVREGRILLVSDGISDRDSKNIAQHIAGSGIQLAILGVGTGTGAPIPLPRGGFLKDANGTIVMPTLDEAPLRTLATATGGRYLNMRVDNSDLDYVLAENLLPSNEQTLALDRTADAWEDQGYLLIIMLLPLALALFRRGWVVCLLPLLFIPPQPAHAQSWDDLWLRPDQQGQIALQQGDNEAAAELFENPDWAGTAAYRAGNYEQAVEAFSSKSSADTLYNRGNALAHDGKLDEAIEAYQESLALKPEQQDALSNIELLEQLKQQQQEQEQQDQQQNENQEKNDEQDQEQDQQQDQSGDQQQDSDQSDKESQSDDQSQQEQQPEQESPEPSEPSEDGEQEQDQQAEEQAQNPEQQAEQQQAVPEPLPEDAELDQAMEQWLRRVPDDPSGLLREKFRYESRQRSEQGDRRDNETYW